MTSTQRPSNCVPFRCSSMGIRPSPSCRPTHVFSGIVLTSNTRWPRTGAGLNMVTFGSPTLVITCQPFKGLMSN
jgi:hypothetical protein